jgi:hypothetical protein
MFYVERDILYLVDADGPPDEVLERSAKFLEDLA